MIAPWPRHGGSRGEGRGREGTVPPEGARSVAGSVAALGSRGAKGQRVCEGIEGVSQPGGGCEGRRRDGSGGGGGWSLAAPGRRREDGGGGGRPPLPRRAAQMGLPEAACGVLSKKPDRRAGEAARALTAPLFG